MTAKIPANTRTARLRPAATTMAASGTKTRTMSGMCQPGPSCPGFSAARNACVPRTRLPRATTSDRIRSIRSRVNEPRLAVASRLWGMLPHALCRTARVLSGAATTGALALARLGQDAVLHRAPEEIDLGGCRPPDLHVLHPHAGDVLLRGRVGHTEPIGHDLEGETCRIQPQHVAFPCRELRIRERTIALHGAGPLDVVEGLAARDRADGGDHVAD